MFAGMHCVCKIICRIEKMFLALSSIILAVSSAITTFIQTITLSGCRAIQCCSSSCDIDAPWFDRPALGKRDDLPVAMKGEDVD